MRAPALRNIGKAAVYGATDVLATAPVLVAGASYVLRPTELAAWMALLAVFSPLGAAVASLLGPARRITLHLCAIVIAAVSAAASFGSDVVAAGMTAAAAYVLALRGMRSVGREWPEEHLPVHLLWVFVFVYFVASLIFPLIHTWQPYIRWINGTGLCFFGLAAWTTNKALLRQETRTGAVVPSIRRKNSLLLLGMLALITAIGSYSLLARMWDALWQVLRGWLSRLFSGGQEPPEEVPMPAPIEPVLPAEPMEPREPTLFLVVMEYVTKIAVILIAGALAVMALIGLYRAIRRWLPRMASWLAEWMEGFGARGSGEGVVDEKNSLFDLSAAGERMRGRLRRLTDRLRGREPKWEQLRDNRERMRYLFRTAVFRAVAAGYAFRRSDTPEETGAKWGTHARLSERDTDLLIGLYNRARYGKGEIDDDEVERVRGAVTGTGKRG